MRRNVSAHTVVVQAGRILLLRRGPTAPWAPGQWDLPGGYLDVAETPAAGAVRELAEETGIYPPFSLRFLRRLPGRTPSYLFLVERPAAYPFMASCPDGEHDAVAWVHPAEVNDYDLAPGIALSLAVACSSLADRRRRA